MAMVEFHALTRLAIEVAVFAVLIYLVLRFLRETRGSGVVRGLAFLLIVGVVSFVVLIKSMELERLALLFRTIGQSVVIALVIVFHPEIRRAIVHLGDSQLFGRFFQKESKIVQRVLRAVARMGKERIGALIAVEREASLQALAESGITIDAELNSFLIESIFYPKSALHDGAIVVRDDRIVAASCLLPLSQNPDVDKRLGTRHRAALGLSEETDALAIVVSEETGKISVAQGGKLSFDLTLEQLERAMDESLGMRQRSSRRSDKGAGRTIWATLVADPVRKAAAVLLAIGLWAFLDSQITATYPATLQLGAIAVGEKVAQDVSIQRLTVSLPMNRVNLREFVDLNSGNPIAEVKITFRGPKNAIENLKAEVLSLNVNLPKVEWDKTESADFTVADVQRPPRAPVEVTMVMEPSYVRVQVVRVQSDQLQLSPDQVELSYGGDDRLKARIREETIEFTPRIANVFGPEQALQAFRARKGERAFAAQLELRQNERQLLAAVTLSPNFVQMGLRLRDPCSLSVQLRPMMETFTLMLPVLIDDLSLPTGMRGQYQPDAQVKEAKVKAGGALLSKLIGWDESGRAQWAKNNLRLWVSIQPRDDDSPYPQEFTALARLHPIGLGREFENPAEYGLAEPVSVVLRRAP